MKGAKKAAIVNNLGFADVWDGVDVIKLVEEAFDVEIADTERQALANAGDLYDLLRKKIFLEETNRKCASALAFYRLRRALTLFRTGERLGPTFDLSHVHGISARKLLRSFASDSGLALPSRTPTWVGRIGQYLAVVAYLAPFAFIAYLIFLDGLLNAPKVPFRFVFPIWLGCWIVGVGLMVLDPGCLPKDCKTLGDLAKKASHLNFGRLRKLGARQREFDLWLSLVEVLSSFNDFPADQIGRNTYFYESSMRNHLKNAA